MLDDTYLPIYVLVLSLPASILENVCNNIERKFPPVAS